MPTYSFEAPDGTVVERFFHGTEVCGIGEDIIEDGRVLTRIPDIPQLRTYQYAHASAQLHRKKDTPEGVWNKWTADGKPYFESKRDVQEYQARREKRVVRE